MKFDGIRKISNNKGGIQSYEPAYQIPLVPDTECAVYDEFGKATRCPFCQTLLANITTMQLLYSTCCGRVACRTCSEKLRGICGLDGCVGQLSSKSWSIHPIDVQRYESEIRHRKKYSGLLNLKQDSFPSKEDYENYLEECQDIIYDYTHGNETIKRKVEERIKQLQKKYNNLFAEAKQSLLRQNNMKKIEQTPQEIFITTNETTNTIKRIDLSTLRSIPQILYQKPPIDESEIISENLAIIKKASANLDIYLRRSVDEFLDELLIL